MYTTTKQSGCFLGSPINWVDLIWNSAQSGSSDLDSIKKRRTIHANVPLLLDGDVPGDIYILVQGVAQIRQKVGTRHVPIRKVESGEILGIRESLSRNRIGYDVVTSTECVVDVISRRDFVRLVRSDCKLCFELLRLIGADLQSSYKRFIACPESRDRM
jgi:CRP-like cAMP-binding protein